MPASNTSVAARPKAYSYLRFSTPEQAAGDSFRRQSSMALAYAAQHGLDLDTSLTFHDLGVSAFKGANAEAGRLAEFREAVETGLVPPGSFLLVEALDRLSRLTPLKALGVLNSIVDLGVTVVTLNDGKQYTSTSFESMPTDLLLALLLFMRANDESVNKSRRLKAAWEAKRANVLTVPLTSVVPAWVRLVKDAAGPRLELVPERAELVRKMFSDYLTGVGKPAIANRLNAAGVPCFGRATRWHRSYIHKILTSRTVIGEYTPHTYINIGAKRVRQAGEAVPGYYPPVVQPDVFEEAQRMMTGRGKGWNRQGVIANLYAGLALCPACGAAMTRVFKGAAPKSGVPKLVCVRAKTRAGCVYRSVRLSEAEQALIDHVDQFMAEAPSGIDGLEDDFNAASAAVDAVESQIGNLVEAIAAQPKPSPSLLAGVAEREAELAIEVARRDALLAQLSAQYSPLQARRMADLRALLIADPLDRGAANAQLRRLVDSVVVDYRSGELVFAWKIGGQTSIRYGWPQDE